jgi:hypothetical protein
MISIGHLNISVAFEKNTFLLSIIGQPYGVETRATPEEVKSLGAYLVREAQKEIDKARVTHT